MCFRLSDGDLREFRDCFSAGSIWSRLREDAEAMRFWHVLGETASEVRMHHGTGAFAVLSITDDRITDISLLQGSEAEELLSREGLRVSPEDRRKAGRFLQRGRMAAEALEAAWPSGLGLEELPAGPASDGGELLRKRFSWGGVLEIETDPLGRIRGYRFREGGDAIDLLRILKQDDQ
ncbi:MAG: hypothetical protein JXA64_12080 [Candidatus Fermentibacteraceae bacterium]|nr:hypothetical protein [Candidatus Fermentibacteraceae bacterium]MBN2609837.1 hypothetical protein [Candidatus Fermentibacteraceae bacterium]